MHLMTCHMYLCSLTCRCVLDGGNVGCYSYTGFKLFPSTDLYISIQTPSNTSPNTDSFIKCTHLTCHQTHTHNELCTNGMRTSPNSVYRWNIKHEPYYQVYCTHIRTYVPIAPQCTNGHSLHLTTHYHTQLGTKYHSSLFVCVLSTMECYQRHHYKGLHIV